MPNQNPTIDQTQIGGQQIQPSRLARPIISSLDTWDHNTQIDYPTPAQNQGARPGWNIPSIAVTSESVNTVQQNQQTRYTSPQIPITVRRPRNPTNTDLAWRPVPNMGQSILTTAHVQVTFSVNITTQSAPDSPQFAIFRDGRKLSQIYQATTVAANQPTLVSGTYVDTSPTMLKHHSYSLMWKRGNSGVIGFEKDRTFQLSNLRAQ